MKIEILFPEISNIYGDLGNIMFLKKALPYAEFIETSLNTEPVFVKEEVDLVYLGSMTEKSQEKVIKQLLPYKEKIKEHIEEEKAMLFTGNSFEIFGQYIESDDGNKIEALRDFRYIFKKRNDE